MGFWLFIVLLIVIGGGIYFCHRLKQIEEEIRLDLGVEADQSGEAAKPEPGPVPDRESTPESAVAAVNGPEAPATVADRLMAVVTESPGILQTEVYTRFADLSRKQLQEELRALAAAGRLERVKQGASYQLFPA